MFVLLIAFRSDRQRRKHVRIQGYVEEVVHFRMNRETFERVLQAFSPNYDELPEQVNRGGRLHLFPQKNTCCSGHVVVMQLSWLQ